MNSTKLSLFCDKVLEIGWLLAVIITPLFFNVYSSRVFEPDKLTTLRTVALVMGVTWLVKYIEERMVGQVEFEFSWRTPLVFPTLLTIVAYLLSTLLSVTFHVSLWGSYQRLQGTYTTMAYIVIFFIILQGLRTRAQVDRLITSVIISSLPIALYGLIQRNKLDPLPWGGNVTRRVASNMGNAIFVAAYLIMAVFPTLGRVMDAFRSILTDEEANAADIPRAAAYIFLFLVQLIAIWYTQSRGPLMGLLAGLGLWMLIGLLNLRPVIGLRKWRWLWGSMLVMVILFAVGFLLINLSGPIHEWALDQPSLNRVSRVLQYQGGTGMVRNLIWQGGIDLIGLHEPIEFPPTQAHPQGQPDPFNMLRPLVGYGPESMYVAYNSFYPPLLGHYESRTASPDRSHNETLDSLITTGLLGFVAYLWLFGSVFYFSLRWLGFIPDDKRRKLFFILLVAGALVACAIVIPLIGLQFIGLAIPIGIVGGLFLYLVAYGFSVWNVTADFEFHPHSFLLISILSTIVAHFVEINFGIAIAATRTVFWAFAGLLVVAGLELIHGRETQVQKQEPKNNRSRSRRKGASSFVVPTWLWLTLVAALIGGFILGTLGFDFITNAERLSQPARIVWRALTILPAQGSRTSYGALMIFALTWLLSAVVFLSEMAKNGAFHEHKGDGFLATVIYLLISLAVGFGFAVILASRQAAMLNVQAQTLDDVLKLADHVASFLTTYYKFIFFALIAGGGILLLNDQRPTRPITQPWGGIALIVLVILAIAVSVTTNLQPIQADIIYKQANAYEGRQWLVAIEHYKRAIELVPYEDFYYLYLGRAYLEYASTLNDPAQRENVLRKTEETLLEAREINPLNTDHSANLARMYRRWADFASDQDARRTFLQKSSENYAIATTLSPQNAILWNEWAILYLSMGDFERAQQTVSHSLKLDPDFAETWWKVQASIYASQNLITKTIEAYERALEIRPNQVDIWLMMGDTYMKQSQLEKAAEAYEQALELKPKRSQVWRVLGSVYAQLNRPDQAAAALEQSLELNPDSSNAWDTHRILAIIYNQLGQNGTALSHAQTALQMGPEDQQEALQDLISQLQSLSEEGQ